MTEYLSDFDLRTIRRDLERATRERFDLFNVEGLQSALAAPRQSMFGEELHPTLIDKAATLFFLLIKNHPFYDGNKRIAVAALRAFLAENGCQLASDDAAALQLARSVAITAQDTDTICRWLEATVQSNPNPRH